MFVLVIINQVITKGEHALSNEHDRQPIECNISNFKGQTQITSISGSWMVQ
jgi:hypothetical protein